MYKVLIAPAAYKGCWSPMQVARFIQNGLEAAGLKARFISCPLADGGDGTIESLQAAVGGELFHLPVKGPLGAPVTACWLRHRNLAVVELAAASGLALLKGQAGDPLGAHTFGTGQILNQCLLLGLDNIVVAVGGSASTDGGTGALRALGARFLDTQGRELPLGGGYLPKLAGCNLGAARQRCSAARIQTATDVSNPLLGPSGAAAVFAPQKGADGAQVDILEKGLSRLADVLEESAGRKCRHQPGSGAAGGAAFGLSLALGAEIISGFDWLAEMVHLNELIDDCNLVISAEGKLDSQSVAGKVIGGLVKRCTQAGKPLWVLPAQVEPGFDYKAAGIDKILAVSPDGRTASHLDLQQAAGELIRTGQLPL